MLVEQQMHCIMVCGQMCTYRCAVVTASRAQAVGRLVLLTFRATCSDV